MIPLIRIWKDRKISFDGCGGVCSLLLLLRKKICKCDATCSAKTRKNSLLFVAVGDNSRCEKLINA